MQPSLQTVGDDELMRRAGEGDRLAFEEIYRRHRSTALRVAMRMVRHPQGAEDVIQEAFLSLWRGAARYRPERSNVRSWVLLVVHSRGIEHIRRSRSRRSETNLDEVSPERLSAPQRTDAQAAVREQSRHLRQLVSVIPIKQRQVIELAYYREMTHTEIAANLDLPLGTVKGRLRLAHGRLHRTMTDEADALVAAS